MNSIPRRQRVLVRVAFGMVIGLLAVVCLSGQAYSQSLTQSKPKEWTSLIAPPIPSEPAFTNPLQDLRQPDPSGLLEQDLPAEVISGNTNYSSRQQRSEPALVFNWIQPEFRHRQLYFQDDQIERGNEKRQFPNVAAGAKFFKSLFVLPIRLVTGR